VTGPHDPGGFRAPFSVLFSLWMGVVVRLGIVGLLWLGGCDAVTESVGTEPDDVRDAGDADTTQYDVTYHRDLRALIQTDCVRCHHSGGSAPFTLETWDDVWAARARIVSTVMDREMPPAQTDPSCRPVIGQHWVSAESRSRFERWSEEGYPQGNPADFEAPHVEPDVRWEALGPPNIVGRMPEPYLPTSLTSTDEDFTSIVLDYVFEETTYIAATKVVPGVPTLVHHATVHLSDADGRHTAEFLPSDDEDLGSLVDTATIAGYAPGQRGYMLPPGAAIVAEAGSHLLLAMHYHRGDLAPDAPIPEDDTHVEIWTLPEGETPTHQAFTRAAHYAGLFIEANDPESHQSGEFSLGDSPMTILGAAFHMHFLGTASRLEVIHPDGSTDCVLDSPNYDFYWQMTHMFAPQHHLDIQPGAKLAIECVYDNSQENQPYISGTQQRSTDVTFGGSSSDEMCTALLVAMTPMVEP
jgi:hypothetical protein